VTDLGAVEATGQRPQFVVALVNEGELALRPRAQVYVRSADGTARGTIFDSGPSLLLPGGAAEMLFALEDPLMPGDHILEATVYYGAGGRIEMKKGFSVGADAAAGGPDAERGTGWYVPVGVSLGAVVLLAILFLLWRRKGAGSALGP